MMPRPTLGPAQMCRPERHTRRVVFATVGLVFLWAAAACGDVVGDTNVLGRVECTIAGITEDGAPVENIAIDALGIFTDDKALWKEVHGTSLPTAVRQNPTVFFAAKPIRMPSGNLRDFYLALAPGNDSLAILYAEYQGEVPFFLTDADQVSPPAVAVQSMDLRVEEVEEIECEEDDSGESKPKTGDRHGRRIYEGTFAVDLTWADPAENPALSGLQTRTLLGCSLQLDPQEDVTLAKDAVPIDCE